MNIMAKDLTAFEFISDALSRPLKFSFLEASCCFHCCLSSSYHNDIGVTSKLKILVSGLVLFVIYKIEVWNWWTSSCYFLESLEFVGFNVCLFYKPYGVGTLGIDFDEKSLCHLKPKNFTIAYHKHHGSNHEHAL